jgi:hypothetical protein
VDGKLFPTRPQVRIRNDGVVVGGHDAPDAGGAGEGSWPSTAVYQHWPNPNSGADGKWTDVRIDVGAPAD